MGGSFKIATIRGIEIKIHWTFVLILLYGAWTGSGLATSSAPGNTQAQIAGGLYGVLLMLILFGIVVLHELGHSVAALRYKIPVRDITLLPLGGVARIERMPEDPRQELVIALAGPAVNFLLVLILGPILALVLGIQMMGDNPISINPMDFSLNGILTFLVSVNLSLAIFNLLPAFPMDGGRVLRALLALFLDYQQATRIAVTIGQGMAILLGLVGLFGLGSLVGPSPLLILIAIFIYFGAGQEGNEVVVRDALRRVCTRDAYNKQAQVLGAGQRVSEVVDTMLTSYQSDFAVMVGSRLAGVVTRDRIVGALRKGLIDATVSEIMVRDVLRVPPNISLYEVRQRMAQQPGNVAAVFDGDQYLGLVSLADISEAFLLLAATPRERQAQRGDQLDSPVPLGR